MERRFFFLWRGCGFFCLKKPEPAHVFRVKRRQSRQKQRAPGSVLCGYSWWDLVEVVVDLYLRVKMCAGMWIVQGHTLHMKWCMTGSQRASVTSWLILPSML